MVCAVCLTMFLCSTLKGHNHTDYDRYDTIHNTCTYFDMHLVLFDLGS